MATQCYGYKAPYAHRTPLGWALVGLVCKARTGHSSQNSVLKVQVDSPIFEHFNAYPIFSKKAFNPNESDPYAEYPDDELPGLSKDDSQFLQTVVPNIQVNKKSNISMPLPFRNKDVNFP